MEPEAEIKNNNFFFMHNSTEHGFIMLYNVKMSTIEGSLTFVWRLNIYEQDN